MTGHLLITNKDNLMTVVCSAAVHPAVFTGMVAVLVHTG